MAKKKRNILIPVALTVGGLVLLVGTATAANVVSNVSNNIAVSSVRFVKPIIKITTIGVRFEMTIQNFNAFDIVVNGFDGIVRFQGRPFASINFQQNKTIPAQSNEKITLEAHASTLGSGKTFYDAYKSGNYSLDFVLEGRVFTVGGISFPVLEQLV